ncbi:MAG: formyltransferase family protein [Magnetovibrionaceae bacterium]
MKDGSITVLTGPVEGPHLTNLLQTAAPGLTVYHAEDRAALEEAEALSRGQPRRLVAFCTNIIVPLPILDAYEAGAYNFHPGPPEYPGIHCSSFALYEGATAFGVTAHEMVAQVDAGRIVGLRRFAINNDANLEELDVEAYLSLAGLFDEMAPSLVDLQRPLPILLGEQWGARKYTRKDFQALEQTEPAKGTPLHKRWLRALNRPNIGELLP